MDEDLPIKIADEIEDCLGDNHVSTVLYGHGLRRRPAEEGRSTFPILVVVHRFDANVVQGLGNIALKWRGHGLEGPYILEMDDIQAMGDSIPEEVLEAVINYRVLKGMDPFKDSLILDKEHLRAQCELALRRYIFTLRWGLIQMAMDQRMMALFIENLKFYTGLAAQLYKRVKGERIQDMTLHEIVGTLKSEFPWATESLDRLIEFDSKGDHVLSELLTLATDIIENVLQRMLSNIDKMGKMFPL